VSSELASAADDRDAIRTLIHAYAERIDGGDIDGVVDLFEKAQLVAADGSAFSGRETLRSLWAGGLKLYDGIPRTHHLITNIDITLSDDGQRATSRSYATVVQAVPGFALQVVAASRHNDTFSKDGGAWHFVERRDHQDLVGDLSRHYRMPGDDADTS
jgi:ketosteroid isomerase-like protein